MALIPMNKGHQLVETRAICQANWTDLAVIGAEVVGPGDGLTKFIKKTNTNIGLANTQLTKTVAPVPLGWPIWRVRDFMNTAFVAFALP